MGYRSVFSVVLAAALWFGLAPALNGREDIRLVEFPRALGIQINGAGPLLIRADPIRRRVVVVHHLTASVSLIDGEDEGVTGIALDSRIPHYLKSAALALHPHTGAVYVIGERCLHVVTPETGSSRCFPTRDQAEMVAVNAETGAAYLVGRESPHLVVVDPRLGSVRNRPWLQRTEPMQNRNATPPPPLRKVVWDGGLQRVVALDADTREMAVFTPAGRLLHRRTLAVASGGRWHWAGFDPGRHAVYVVIETDKRKVVQAVRLNLQSAAVSVVALPGLTEAVGVSLDPNSQTVFIPYDNHPTVHRVDFGAGSGVTEIAVPAFGNDASVIDAAGQRLFVAEWAHSEVLEVDLRHLERVRRHRNVEVLPHMFHMASLNRPFRLYIPSGATAVNGAFGASLSRLDPQTGSVSRVRTGWAPIGLAPRSDGPGVLVFDSENHMALVKPDGSWSERTLPGRYFHQVVQGADGRVYISFGAHQSFWPVHYIGGAFNGVVDIDPDTLAPRWRRLPRLAQAMTLDGRNRLFALQNNWGEEDQFVALFPDAVREFDPGKRWKTGDRVTRETTQRLLAWDRETDGLFLVRLGENPGDPGILQVISAADGKVLHRLKVGRTPVDLCVAGERAGICVFDEDCVLEVNKRDGTLYRKPVGKHPVGIRPFQGGFAVLCQGDRTLRLLHRTPARNRTVPIAAKGSPTGIFNLDGRIWITLHSANMLRLLRLNDHEKGFETVMEADYPYGRVTADTDNAAFFVRGQYGDCRYALSHMCRDKDGRVYLTDFLSGRLWIVSAGNTQVGRP